MKARLPFVLQVATAVALAGCVVGDDVPTDDDLPPEISEAARGDNAHTAFNYFVSKGLTEIQAAGIVGNLMQESSLRPTAVEYGGGPGRGIAQWSLGGRWNAGGQDNMVWFASARGLERWTLGAQLDFIWYELTTFDTYGLDELRAATTLYASVYAFQSKFERCGRCAAGRRFEYAQDALTQYGGSTSSGGSTTPGDTCYSGTLEREVPENTCVESKFDGLWYQCADGAWVDRWSDPEPCVSVHPL